MPRLNNSTQPILVIVSNICLYYEVEKVHITLLVCLLVCESLSPPTPLSHVCVCVCAHTHTHTHTHTYTHTYIHMFVSERGNPDLHVTMHTTYCFLQFQLYLALTLITLRQNVSHIISL